LTEEMDEQKGEEMRSEYENENEEDMMYKSF
jgi:hypothetical protein